MNLVMPTALLHRDAPRHAGAGDARRRWTAASLAQDGFDASFAVPDAVHAELRDALAHASANGLSLETIEQEDIRLPSLARHVAALRARLDAPPGIVVLRGLPVVGLTDDATGIVAWGIANYLGRPIRQGLARDKKLFTVTNTGAANTDAIRIGASARESWPHTDNACLEMRPPHYIGLFCVQDALAGGDSTVISAASILAEVEAEDAGLAAVLFEKFHFLPPQLHTWPAGPPTIVKPILEWSSDGVLHIHYARVMVDAGMARAGTQLTDRQRAALDLLDSVIARPGLAWTTRLAPGDFLFVDNLANLHGRRAFTDDDSTGRRRVLKRVWLWRRHAGPGDDPAALDLAELT